MNPHIPFNVKHLRMIMSSKPDFLSEIVTVPAYSPSVSQIEMQYQLFHNSMIISDLRMKWLLNEWMM